MAMVGGDFFDAVMTEDGLTVVLADVSGKGVSAALLASTLQGMIYSQLIAGMPLIEIVAAVRLKDEFGVEDGDQLILEFVN